MDLDKADISFQVDKEVWLEFKNRIMTKSLTPSEAVEQLMQMANEDPAVLDDG